MPALQDQECGFSAIQTRGDVTDFFIRAITEIAAPNCGGQFSNRARNFELFVRFSEKSSRGFPWMPNDRMHLFSQKLQALGALAIWCMIIMSPLSLHLSNIVFEKTVRFKNISVQRRE